MKRFVVGITGASGAVYAARLLDVLSGEDCEVHVAMSASGAAVAAQELGVELAPNSLDWQALAAAGRRWLEASQPGWRRREANPLAAKISVWSPNDMMAPIASGSHLTDAMVVCPCSGGTLAAVAAAASGNLIQRAAEVHLKERRKLVLVPRETPLSAGHIDNLQRVTSHGAVVLPAAPGFYHGALGAADLVDFVVARICDQIGVDRALVDRWGSPPRHAET